MVILSAPRPAARAQVEGASVTTISINLRKGESHPGLQVADVPGLGRVTALQDQLVENLLAMMSAQAQRARRGLDDDLDPGRAAGVAVISAQDNRRVLSRGLG